MYLRHTGHNLFNRTKNLLNFRYQIHQYKIRTPYVDVQLFGHLGNFVNGIMGLVAKYLIKCLNCVTIEKYYGTPSYDYFGHAYSSSIHIQLYTCSLFTLGQKFWKNISLEIFNIILWYYPKYSISELWKVWIKNNFKFCQHWRIFY